MPYRVVPISDIMLSRAFNIFMWNMSFEHCFVKVPVYIYQEIFCTTIKNDRQIVFFYQWKHIDDDVLIPKILVFFLFPKFLGNSIPGATGRKSTAPLILPVALKTSGCLIAKYKAPYPPMLIPVIALPFRSLIVR